MYSYNIKFNEPLHKLLYEAVLEAISDPNFGLSKIIKERGAFIGVLSTEIGSVHSAITPNWIPKVSLYPFPPVERSCENHEKMVSLRKTILESGAYLNYRPFSYLKVASMSGRDVTHVDLNSHLSALSDYCCENCKFSVSGDVGRSALCIDCIDRLHTYVQSDSIDDSNVMDLLFINKREKCYLVSVKILSTTVALIYLPCSSEDTELQNSLTEYSSKLGSLLRPILIAGLFTSILSSVKNKIESSEVNNTTQLTEYFVSELVRCLVPDKISYRIDKNCVSYTFDPSGYNRTDGEANVGGLNLTINEHTSIEIDPRLLHDYGDDVLKISAAEYKAVESILSGTYEFLSGYLEQYTYRRERDLVGRVGHIVPRMKQLVALIEESGAIASMIATNLNESTGFLRAYPVIRLLFRDDKTVRYRVVSSGRIVDDFVLLTEESGQLGENEYSFETAHNAKKIKWEHFDNYLHFIQSYGRYGNIRFLDEFSDGVRLAYDILCDEKNCNRVQDSLTTMAFSSFKSVMHDSRFYGKGLAVWQLYIPAIIASSKSRLPINIKFRCRLSGTTRIYLEREVKHNTSMQKILSDFLIEISKSKVDDGAEKVPYSISMPEATLPKHMAADVVMTCVLQLIGEEFQKKLADDLEVIVKELSIDFGDELEDVASLELICRKTFSARALELICELDEDSASHGLRSCISSLCDSTNQRSPVVIEPGDEMERRQKGVYIQSYISDSNISSIPDSTKLRVNWKLKL